MSASSKKKIRKEQNAAQLSERQRKERAEAKKLKIYSIAFTVLIVAILITAITVITYKAIENSGIVNKLTTSLTVGDHKINAVEMNYYYMDVVNGTYNEWAEMYGESLPTMLSLMGLDLTQPLDQQEYDADGTTWADYFMDAAIENATNDYVLSDAAKAAGFALPEEEELNITSQIGTIEMQAMLSGYDDMDMYVAAYYGNGSTFDSYLTYVRRSSLATAYYNHYNEELSFTDEQISQYGTEHDSELSSYSFAEYTLTCSSFLTEGTTDEEGNTTYTDEQNEAAKAAAKAAADELAKNTTLEELDAAIAALEINKDKEEAVASTKATNILYSGLPANYQEWLSDSARTAGQITVIENTSTSTDADGNETSTVTGYTVLCFVERNDNREKMDSVRHLLVTPEVVTDEVTGEEEATEETKQVAKETAEMHLNSWKTDDGTEEGFIELVKESSEDTGSVENGGLFENLHRDANYEPAFLAWAIDPARVKGETGIVETSYGYHVMYYVGEGEQTYRDHMITEALRTTALEEWHTGLKDSVTVKRGNLSRIDTSSVLFAATGA